jgi:hypothetical protein
MPEGVSFCFAISKIDAASLRRGSIMQNCDVSRAILAGLRISFRHQKLEIATFVGACYLFREQL